MIYEFILPSKLPFRNSNNSHFIWELIYRTMNVNDFEQWNLRGKWRMRQFIVYIHLRKCLNEVIRIVIVSVSFSKHRLLKYNIPGCEDS